MPSLACCSKRAVFGVGPVGDGGGQEDNRAAVQVNQGGGRTQQRGAREVSGGFDAEMAMPCSILKSVSGEGLLRRRKEDAPSWPVLDGGKFTGVLFSE